MPNTRDHHLTEEELQVVETAMMRDERLFTALSMFEHRVMVVWLPLYCSDLKPIKRF